MAPDVSPSLQQLLTDQVLLVDWISLATGEVVEEYLHVGVEGKLPRPISRNETEHFHGAVGSNIKIPVETGKIYGGDFAADRVHATNARKPDSVSGGSNNRIAFRAYQTINS